MGCLLKIWSVRKSLTKFQQLLLFLYFAKFYREIFAKHFFSGVFLTLFANKFLAEDFFAFQLSLFAFLMLK